MLARLTLTLSHSRAGVAAAPAAWPPGSSQSMPAPLLVHLSQGGRGDAGWVRWGPSDAHIICI